MTVEERKQEILKLNDEMRKFVESRDVENARLKKDEIRAAKELLQLQIEQEEEERVELGLQGKKKEERGVSGSLNKEVEYRAILKAISGKQLTEEEQRAITTANVVSNSAAILPQGFVNQVQLIRKGYNALKDYCHVIPVTTNTGKMPIATVGGKLANLAEDTEMVKGMLATKPVDYSVADYGLLKAIADNVIEDSPVNFIEGVIAEDFAEASINTENEKIMTLVAAKATAVTVGADVKVEDVLAKTVSKAKPSIRNGMVIVTNTEGHAYLDNLKDAQGRKDDRVSYVGDSMYFKGKEVIEVDEGNLPALTSSKTMVFYTANLKKLVKFFSRKDYEIAKSTEAGFTLNQTLVKVLERFDVKDADATDVSKIEA